MEAVYGTILALGFDFAPENWAFCNGDIVAINQYTATFSLVGSRYGGDGRITFGIPDLCGRAAVGYGASAPNSVTGGHTTIRFMGNFGGEETAVLTEDSLPSHSHSISSSDGPELSGTVTGAVDTQVMVTQTHGTQQIPTGTQYIGQPSNSFGTAAQGNLFVPEPLANAAGIVPVLGVSSGLYNAQSSTPNPLRNAEIGKTGSDLPYSLMQPFMTINYVMLMDNGAYPRRS